MQLMATTIAGYLLVDIVLENGFLGGVNNFV